jgi:hypothetical protein
VQRRSFFKIFGAGLSPISPFFGVRRKVRQVGAPKKCAEFFRPQNPETLAKSLGALFEIFGAPQKLRRTEATQKSAVF